MSDIQLKGALEIGGLDVKSQVSSMIIKRERSSVTVPATLGNIRETEKAGSLKQSLEITFFSDLTAAGFWADLYDAIDTDTAVLSFEGTMSDAVVSADNPTFSGDIVILGVETGATVGTLRGQSQTYPITGDGITVDDGS